jgi:hypothetical protein
MQGGDHDAVSPSIQQSECEALVAARVVKRAESHQTHMPNHGWHDMHDAVVLFLHASYRLCRASHRI